MLNNSLPTEANKMNNSTHSPKRKLKATFSFTRQERPEGEGGGEGAAVPPESSSAHNKLQVNLLDDDEDAGISCSGNEEEWDDSSDYDEEEDISNTNNDEDIIAVDESSKKASGALVAQRASLSRIVNNGGSAPSQYNNKMPVRKTSAELDNVSSTNKESETSDQSKPSEGDIAPSPRRQLRATFSLTRQERPAAAETTNEAEAAPTLNSARHQHNTLQINLLDDDDDDERALDDNGTATEYDGTTTEYDCTTTEYDENDFSMRSSGVEEVSRIIQQQLKEEDKEQEVTRTHTSSSNDTNQVADNNSNTNATNSPRRQLRATFSLTRQERPEGAATKDPSSVDNNRLQINLLDDTDNGDIELFDTTDGGDDVSEDGTETEFDDDNTDRDVIENNNTNNNNSPRRQLRATFSLTRQERPKEPTVPPPSSVNNKLQINLLDDTDNGEIELFDTTDGGDDVSDETETEMDDDDTNNIVVENNNNNNPNNTNSPRRQLRATFSLTRQERPEEPTGPSVNNKLQVNLLDDTEGNGDIELFDTTDGGDDVSDETETELDDDDTSRVIGKNDTTNTNSPRRQLRATFSLTRQERPEEPTGPPSSVNNNKLQVNLLDDTEGNGEIELFDTTDGGDDVTETDFDDDDDDSTTKDETNNNNAAATTTSNTTTTTCSPRRQLRATISLTRQERPRMTEDSMSGAPCEKQEGNDNAKLRINLLDDDDDDNDGQEEEELEFDDTTNNYDDTTNNCDDTTNNYDDTTNGYDDTTNNYDETTNNYDVTTHSLDETSNNYDVTAHSLDDTTNNYDDECGDEINTSNNQKQPAQQPQQRQEDIIGSGGSEDRPTNSPRRQLRATFSLTRQERPAVEGGSSTDSPRAKECDNSKLTVNLFGDHSGEEDIDMDDTARDNEEDTSYNTYGNEPYNEEVCPASEGTNNNHHSPRGPEFFGSQEDYAAATCAPKFPSASYNMRMKKETESYNGSEATDKRKKSLDNDNNDPSVRSPRRQIRPTYSFTRQERPCDVSTETGSTCKQGNNDQNKLRLNLMDDTSYNEEELDMDGTTEHYEDYDEETTNNSAAPEEDQRDVSNDAKNDKVILKGANDDSGDTNNGMDNNNNSPRRQLRATFSFTRQEREGAGSAGSPSLLHESGHDKLQVNLLDEDDDERLEFDGTTTGESDDDDSLLDDGESRSSREKTAPNRVERPETSTSECAPPPPNRLPTYNSRMRKVGGRTGTIRKPLRRGKPAHNNNNNNGSDGSNPLIDSSERMENAKKTPLRYNMRLKKSNKPDEEKVRKVPDEKEGQTHSPRRQLRATFSFTKEERPVVEGTTTTNKNSNSPLSLKQHSDHVKLEVNLFGDDFDNDVTELDFDGTTTDDDDIGSCSSSSSSDRLEYGGGGGAAADNREELTSKLLCHRSVAQV